MSATEQNFSPVEIIRKKRDKQELSAEEIKWFIKGVTKGEIPDYQMSAFLMAGFINGLNTQETAALTDSMLHSGKVLNFNDPTVIDKHSTGGVGDKASFILAPMAAACGVKVPMIAGRGLGHTGGTVDKIEAIPGFKTSIPLSEFEKLVKQNGIVLIGQTSEIAPADKKIYALRDVTATVESIPFITASIMSKKIAEGTSGIVMDVKTGPGAFMKTLEDSKALADSIQKTGLRCGLNMMTIITDMSQPLGYAVGNSLEMIESIETLKGKGPKDLEEISVQLAGGMIYLAGLAKDHQEGMNKARKTLADGSALKMFHTLIKAQGGDVSYLENYSKFQVASEKLEVCAKEDCYITSMNNMSIGLACVDLGGGRYKAEDKIDFGVGFIFHKKIGEKINKGESILTIYHNKDQKNLASKISDRMLNEIIKFSTQKPTKQIPLVYETTIERVK